MRTPATFLKETGDELKKVTWPSQKEVARLTLVVIIVSIAVGLFIGVLDFTFTKAITLVIR